MGPGPTYPGSDEESFNTGSQDQWVDPEEHDEGDGDLEQLDFSQPTQMPISSKRLYSRSRLQQLSGSDVKDAEKRLNNAKTDAIMKIETLPDSRVKAITRLFFLTIVVGASAVIALFVMKINHLDDQLTGTPLITWNLVVGLFDFSIMGYAVIFMSWRIHQANRENKNWSYRRKRNTCIFMVELCAQTVLTIGFCCQFANSLFYLAPNVYVLLKPCGWIDKFIDVCGFMRFTCWNLLFFLSIVLASNGIPYVNRKGEPIGRSDATLMDAPLWIHAWKLLPWAIFQGLIVCLIVHVADYEDPHGDANSDHPFCTGRMENCGVDMETKLLTIGVGLTSLFYFIFVVVRLKQALNGLKGRPYGKYRLNNIILRLQTRMRFVAYAFIAISLGLLWFVRMGSCASYALGWLGFLPMQLVMSVLLFLMARLFHPIKPGKDFVLSTWLQEFSWSEREIAEKKMRRGNGQCTMSQPMFCFETATKLYYWSELVYDYREVEDGYFTLPCAMELYNLSDYEVFLEPLHDTKVLLGWSNEHIVLAFRGTKTVKNIVADLKLYRKFHPPQRNSLWNRPMVHSGFLDSWQSNGLNEKILQKVKDIISKRSPESDRHPSVLVTGHSLGGALASLAAIDIAHSPEIPKCCIRCYTYGAPRTGNHAFAADYNTKVPDTWHIINDQDYITQTLKFIRMYKRHGNRAIINSRGDLIVTPSFLEINVLKKVGHVNVAHHLLSSYRKSLIAVVEAQFKSEKRMEGGMDALLDLLRNQPTPQMSKVLGVSRASLIRLSEQEARKSALSKRLTKKDSVTRLVETLKLAMEEAGHSFFSAANDLVPVTQAHALKCSGMCPYTTMACGRKICRDLSKGKKARKDLRLEGGYICSVSLDTHITFDDSFLSESQASSSHTRILSAIDEQKSYAPENDIRQDESLV